MISFYSRKTFFKKAPLFCGAEIKCKKAGYKKEQDYHDDNQWHLRHPRKAANNSFASHLSPKGQKIDIRKGSALIVCFLLSSLFIVLSLGLLLNSQIFLEVQGIRKTNRLSAYAAENGIKQAWEKIENKCQDLYGGAEIGDELFQQLQLQLKAGKIDLIYPLLTEALNQAHEETSRMSWETASTGQLTRLDIYDQYLQAIFEIELNSRGNIQGFNGKTVEGVSLSLSFFAGYLPLNQVALTFEKSRAKDENNERIKIISTDKNNFSPEKPIAMSGPFIPDDALPIISRGLKILRPDHLPNWLLRQALGLEPGNKPVPDGVYLIKNDLGLGGLYVQGDLNEILLGVEGTYQLVQFTQAEKRWLLKFDPGQAKTFFYSPNETLSFDLLPIPVIMANGQVESLASGQPAPDGYLVTSETEVPAFIPGVKLTLVCSGKINITSSLTPQGLEWRNGLPYLKSRQSQLTIWSTGKDFQSEEIIDGGINLVNENYRDQVISAFLIAGGQGLKISKSASETKIIGSLSATGLDLNSNSLTVFHPDDETVSRSHQPDFNVYSERPLLVLNNFRLDEWRFNK